MSNTVVTIGAPSGQTQVSVSSADIIYVTVAAGFTGQGDGGGGANLSTTRTATTVTVVSDSGTDATIAAADGSNAGVMTAAMKTKLDGIESGAEVNDTASEILTKLLTVDGSGSGLDADTLDGNNSSAFAAASHTHSISEVTGLQTALDGKVDENAAITPATKTKVTYDSKGLVTAGADAAIADITGLQTALDGKVDENAAITPATKTKVTYDAKGLVTAGADATTADIADSSNKRYVTDAQLTVISNTSGTNTGDQTITLTGDVTGSGTGSFAATIANGAVTNAKVGTGIDAAKIADGTVSNAEFQTLDGVTSSIQTQINGKANSSHTHSATDITSGTLDGDRLPGLSATKRGGVPATGTPSGLFLKDDGTWATPATGGVSDGDKGDITVSASGATWTIDNDVVSYGKIQNVSAASKLLGRGSASGSGDVEELSIGTGLSLSGTTLIATGTGTAITLNRDFTQKGPSNTTTKTAIYSYALPTDLAAGDTLMLHLHGTYLNNSGSSQNTTLTCELGATTLFTHTLSMATSSTINQYHLQLLLHVVSTTSQKISFMSASQRASLGTSQGMNNALWGSMVAYNSSSENLTSSKTLQLAVTLATANANYNVFCEGATLIKYPAP